MASGWGVGGNRSAIWADDDALFGQPLAPQEWLEEWSRRAWGAAADEIAAMIEVWRESGAGELGGAELDLLDDAAARAAVAEWLS